MASQDAVRVHGELMPSVSAERRALTMRVPLGVVGVVTPWNWPYTMMAELVAPALAAGNTVVWVPAPTTAACSGQLAAALVDAGLPRGVFNFLPGPGPVVGAALVGHPGVDGVGFIGSVATGQEVARRSAGKAQILELTNRSPYGLTASVFTEDLERGLAFAESARAGWVNVNASTNYWESHLPFGGRSGSASGRGRVGGRCVLDAFTETKTVILPAPRPLGRDGSLEGQ
jgi:acyl-CoA reductase-like NAD-dependent aldehyde dehydrogenase